MEGSFSAISSVCILLADEPRSRMVRLFASFSIAKVFSSHSECVSGLEIDSGKYRQVNHDYNKASEGYCCYLSISLYMIVLKIIVSQISVNC